MASIGSQHGAPVVGLARAGGSRTRRARCCRAGWRRWRRTAPASASRRAAWRAAPRPSRRGVLTLASTRFRSPTPAASVCISPSPLCTCSRRSDTCLNDAPRRCSSVACSFSSTVARISSSFFAFSLRSTSSRCSTRRAHGFQALLVRARELGEALAEVLHLLALPRRHARRAAAASPAKNRASAGRELGARRRRRRRALAARGREVAAHVALEVRRLRREHLDAGAQLRRFARRGVARGEQRGEPRPGQRDQHDQCQRRRRARRAGKSVGIDHGAASLRDRAGAAARERQQRKRSRASARRCSRRSRARRRPAARCARGGSRRAPSCADRPRAAPRRCRAQHHARDRLRPSRCTICGSLRSPTGTGASSVAGARRETRQAALEPRGERGTGGSTAAHQQRLDQRRRQEVGARRLQAPRRVARRLRTSAQRRRRRSPRRARRRSHRARSRARSAARTRCSGGCRGGSGYCAMRQPRAVAADERVGERQRAPPTSGGPRRRRRGRARRRASAATPSRRCARTTASPGARGRRSSPAIAAASKWRSSRASIAARCGSAGDAPAQRRQQPVHVHAGVPVVAAVERRVQRARRGRVGRRRQHVVELVREFALDVGERQRGEACREREVERGRRHGRAIVAPPVAGGNRRAAPGTAATPPRATPSCARAP